AGSNDRTVAAPLRVVVTEPFSAYGTPPTWLSCSATVVVEVIPSGRLVVSGVSRGAAIPQPALARLPIVRVVPSGVASVRDPSAPVVSTVAVRSGAVRVRRIPPATRSTR